MKQLLKSILIVVILISGFTFSSYSQGLIRISQAGQLADTLNLWGDINNPGRYLVPRGISIPELISYAEGPILEGATKVSGIEVFISRYNKSQEIEELKVFRFKPNNPLPYDFRRYPLRNNDIITIKTKRRPTFGEVLRTVTPILTFITTGLLAYDRLRK